MSVNKTQGEIQEEKVLLEQKRAKVSRNLRQLESSFNPEADKIAESIKQGKKILLGHANFANFAFFGIGAAEKEPTTFDETMNHR
jgi:hypothetical protein